MKRHSSGNFAPSGFTLVELVMVLAIMAILAGIAAPRYSASLSRYRVDMAVRRVASDFELAGAMAKQTGKPIVMTFNSTAGSYTLSGVANLRQSSGDYAVDLSIEPYRTGLATVQLGSGSVTFSIYGQPSIGGKVFIQLGDYSKSALLDQTSGKVTIQ